MLERLARDVLRWAIAHPQLAATLLGGLAGAGGAARRYRRTGSLPLAALPWRLIRRVGYTLRRRFFSTSAPPRDQRAIVDGDLDAVTAAVGGQSYEPAWPLSYHYRGEDLNARRYYYDPDQDLPHRQLHIRGWTHDDGTVGLDAHEEPSALHHPRAHLRSSDMTDATAWVGDRYDAGNGLDPRGFDA